MKDDISTEQFDDPTRDIQSLKLKERYGVGILNGGLGIAVAKILPSRKLTLCLNVHSNQWQLQQTSLTEATTKSSLILELGA